MTRPRARRRRPPPPFAPRLVLMLKEPVAGRVKTRLGRDIGSVEATRFYRHATAATVARLAADRRWRSVLAVSPDGALASRFWPRTRHLARMAQGGGDLGQRMQRILDALPPGPVLIVGTDIPAIRPAHIAAAFAALGQSDVVFGPAEDGGYWLVGLRRRPRILRAFRGVRWSHALTLADNMAAVASHEIAFAATLADVDHAADWRPARATAPRRVLPSLVALR